MTRVAAALAGSLLVVSLAGCTFSDTTVPTASPTPTSSPTAEPTARPTIPNGVVGAGVLQPGGIELSVRHDADGFYLLGLPDNPPADWYGLAFSSTPAGPDACLDEQSPLLWGLPWPSTVALFEKGNLSDDPSHLGTVAIYGQPGQACSTPVIASGDFTWSIPEQFPDLSVVDSGETGGAIGAVTLDGTIPVSYLVHKGDVLEEVAARFGITPEELQWLNPTRNGKAQLVADETLNLSPDLR